MTQATFWQNQLNNAIYAELCNALYERELAVLVQADDSCLASLPAKLKSLPHYIKRAAYLMVHAETPMMLDSQNASWNFKQSIKNPALGQKKEIVNQWYQKHPVTLGLVIPISLSGRIVLDCIDRVDDVKSRFRSNVYGWHSVNLPTVENENKNIRLLKPTKQIMITACAGHVWSGQQKQHPQLPSIRELLLSCQINWKNFKKPLKNE